MVSLAMKRGHRGVIQSMCVLFVGLFIYLSSAKKQGPQRGPDSSGLLQLLSSQLAGHPPLTENNETQQAHVPKQPFRPSLVNRVLPLTLAYDRFNQTLKM